MVPISTSIIPNVIGIIHMLWMGSPALHHHATLPPPHFSIQNLGSWPNSWVAAWLQRCHGDGALVEAPDPHGMVPISTPNIWKVLGNMHMLWMGRPVTHHATTTTLVDPEFRKLAKISGHSLDTNDVFVMVHWNEAPDPHGMAYDVIVMVHWLKPQTHLEWFPYPLQTYGR